MIIIKFLAAILLLVALGRLPYGYYIFMRWLITIIAGICSYDAWKKGKTSWVWAFVAIVVLFNPILPIYLSKEVWTPIDIISAIVFLSSIGAVKVSEKKGG